MVVEIRADDPRTVLLTGTPFYTWAPYVWYAMTVVLGTYFGLYRGLFFLRLLLCVSLLSFVYLPADVMSFRRCGVPGTVC